MRRILNVFAVVSAVVALSLLVGACGVGSYRARSVDRAYSPLVNPELLQKGAGDEALWRYVNPKANVKSYTKVLIDPVVVLKDGELDAKERENYQALANNAHVYLTQELGKGYGIATSPEPGAMRIQMAILDADSAKPVRNTLSTILPFGAAASVVKYAATGKQSGVGEITCEIRFSDASTGMLLGAALDRRVGGKELSKLWSDWHNADDALQYWAKRTAYTLCDMRGGKDCVKP